MSARTTLASREGRASGLLFGETSARPRAVLLGLHGAGHAADSFAPLFADDALASTRRFALDLPGRHGSDGAPRTSAAAAASFAEGVREAWRAELGAVPWIAVGHSFGGAVALELALGGHVDGAVLVSTGARLRVRPEILSTMEAVARGEAARARGVGYGPDASETLVDALEARFAEVPATTTLADWRAANAFDRLDDLAGITVPTLVIGGDADPFTPWKYAEHLASRIPGAILHRVAGGSHMALVERSPELAVAIATFLDRCPARTREPGLPFA